MSRGSLSYLISALLVVSISLIVDGAVAARTGDTRSSAPPKPTLHRETSVAVPATGAVWRNALSTTRPFVDDASSRWSRLPHRYSDPEGKTVSRRFHRQGGIGRPRASSSPATGASGAQLPPVRMNGAQPLLPPHAVARPLPGWHEGTLSHGGQERVYRFYVPGQLVEGLSPLLLLHGGTQGMDELFYPNAGGTQAWPEIAESNGFLLLVPNGIDVDSGSPRGNNQNWNDCRSPQAGAVTGSTADDVGFLMALVDWAARSFPVSGRLRVTGSSNGGLMAYRLATERPERIAGVAAFVANLPAGGECADPVHPVPILIVNGTSDPIMPYAGGQAGDRGEVRSAEATRDAWLAANGADGLQPQVRTLPDLDTVDASIVVCETYSPSGSGAAVEYCRVEGGGHTMPSIAYQLPRWLEQIVGRQNHDVEGARLAWSFLSRMN